MANGYEINELAKEESWRLFRIIGEMVTGFDKLANIEPAVTVYGSARLRPEDSLYDQTTEIARRLAEAGFSIVTGGGPGVMEAANRGALEGGGKSIGLNIELPEEQCPNTYTTLSISFDHFFARKVMLVKYATAFVIMPGGMGTLDEFSEVITLMQTHKIKPFPVILYDGRYWSGFLHWLENTVLLRQFISEEDLDLLRVCDDPDEVVEAVCTWYQQQKVLGKKAVSSQGG